MTKKIMQSIQLSRLLPAIREEFCKVIDNRSSEASALGYPLVDVLMSGLAMMFVQDPSMLEFQKRLQERYRNSNLHTIFQVDDIPQGSQFRRILDPLDPKAVQAAFRPCIKRLQQTRLWEGFRVLDGRYAVLIDGFEFFRSEKKGCTHCLEFHHKDERVDYAHKALAATLAHPTVKEPIPLLLEEIRNEDGKTKQDCEFNAAKRLIPELAKQHPHMDMIIVGDGLFSKLPMVRCILEAGMNYILVAKPLDHETIEENIAGLRLCNGISRLEFTSEDGSHHTYEWAHGLELISKSVEKTDWFACKIVAKNGKTYKNSWISSIKPTRKNIKEMVEVGRHRWQIENQVFNVLKNHGHHLEHNFGHGKQHLAFNFVVLNFLAYMLHQIISLADPLFRALREWTGTRYRCWEDIRGLLNYFVWPNWEALMIHMLDRNQEAGMNSS